MQTHLTDAQDDHELSKDVDKIQEEVNTVPSKGEKEEE